MQKFYYINNEKVTSEEFFKILKNVFYNKQFIRNCYIGNNELVIKRYLIIK